jgi:hypothetical protein
MSSLTNNAPNRISSITTNNNTYLQGMPCHNNNTTDTINDCDGSSLPSTLGLAAMGLAAAASLAAVTTNNIANSNTSECDFKRNSSSTTFKLHHNAPDEHYTGFYSLNRTISQPPPPSSVPVGNTPFNVISSSPHGNLPFIANQTG